MICGTTNCQECGGPCPTSAPLCDSCKQKLKEFFECDHPDLIVKVAVNRLSDIKRWRVWCFLSTDRVFAGVPLSKDAESPADFHEIIMENTGG